MQSVKRQSGGNYRLGPGTLYANLDRLLAGGLVSESERKLKGGDIRREYCLTPSGEQVLRFEVPGSDENQATAIAEHGTRLFGTPFKPAWGRLRQLTAIGTTRDVYYLGRAQFVIGRGEGDLLFPEDDFMSRRHAVVMSDGATGHLDDLGSSNGTYIRLRSPRQLADGDQIRIGDQVLRFEG